jgi:hypothetical protein
MRFRDALFAEFFGTVFILLPDERHAAPGVPP